MNQPNSHIDPMSGMFDALAERVAGRLEEKLRQLVGDHQAGLLENTGLNLMKVYSPQEVCEILGTERVESIYAISQEELPRVKRLGTRIGYLGINLLCYIHNLPPIDMESVVKAYRDRLMSEAPTVRPINAEASGKIRVL